jgi:hypothetical protein
MLSEGKDQVPVGFGQAAFDNFELKRQGMFQGLAEIINNSPHSIREY